MEDIIDQATIAREIICNNKQVKPISKIEYRKVRTKLKMNKANDLNGWKNEFIKHAGKYLEISIFEMLNEVVRYVTMPKKLEFMKISSIYRGNGNKMK